MSPLRNVDGQAAALLAALAGVTPKPEDYQVLTDVFARNPDGTLASPHFRLHSNRDDLTRVLTCCALGWLYLASEPLVLWTTDRYVTARESFYQLADVIDAAPVLRSRVARIRRTNGDQEIRLTDGPRLMMRTRRMSTRGCRVGRLIIDEAGLFKGSQAAELFPAMASVADHQVIYGYA